jgi:hypothetical protein
MIAMVKKLYLSSLNDLGQPFHVTIGSFIEATAHALLRRFRPE